MISPQEQQVLRPPVEVRNRPFLSPIFIIIACILVPLVLPYALTTGNDGSELQVAAMVLGLLAIGVVLAHPFWGLVLFIGLIFIRPEEAIPALAGMHFTLLVSIVTLVATLFQLGLSKQRFVRDPINLMIMAFGLIVVVSTLFSGGLNTATAAEDVAKLVILVLLVLNLVRKKENLRHFLSSLIVFTTYLAGYALYLYMSGVSLHVEEEGVDRLQATGIFNDPNDLAATMVAGLGLVLGRIVTSRGSVKGFYLALAGILITAIITTNSRGGLLGLIAVLSGAFIVYGRRKTLAITLAVIVGAVTFFAAPARMSNFDEDEESANSRFYYWDNGFTMLTESPFIGVGYQEFEDRNNGATAHNSFVLCFAELGLTGYFVWMGCLYYSFRRKRLEEVPEEDLRDLSSARIALAGFLVVAYWISRTYIPILYVYIALATVAYLTAASKSKSARSKEEPVPFFADWPRIALACLVSLMFIKAMVYHYV